MLPDVTLYILLQYERPVSSGSVTFDQDPSEFPVSKPLHKLGAEVQVMFMTIFGPLSG
jgi:hypothetical protein